MLNTLSVAVDADPLTVDYYLGHRVWVSDCVLTGEADEDRLYV
jgi:hypothetical protein